MTFEILALITAAADTLLGCGFFFWVLWGER